MTLKKLILWVLGFVFLIIAFTGFINRTFIYRIVTYPDLPITQSDWYKPMETVAGDFSEGLPVSEPHAIQISPKALEAVAAYARERNSSALLIMYNDTIILEEYWRGHSRE